MKNPPDVKNSKHRHLDDAALPSRAARGFFGSGSTLDPLFPSNESDSASALVNYLYAVDSAASADAVQVFFSPINVEEDVIVMDAIPVPKIGKGGGEGRPHLQSIVKRGKLSNNPSIGGIENRKPDKNKPCRYLDACKYGPTCQFAHGKDALLRPSSSFLKNNNNLETAESSKPPSLDPTKPLPKPKLKAANEMDWNPLDDAIEVSLPGTSSTERESHNREEVDAYIEKVLNGPWKKTSTSLVI